MNNQSDVENTISTENSYMQYGEPMLANSNDPHEDHISGHKEFRQELIDNKVDNYENIVELLDAHIGLHEQYESLI